MTRDGIDDDNTDYKYPMLNMLGIGIEVSSSWGCCQNGFQINQLALKRLCQQFVLFLSFKSMAYVQVTLMDSPCSNALDEPYQALCRGHLKFLPVSLASVIAIDAFSSPSLLLIWVGAPGSKDGGSCIDHTPLSVFFLTFASLSSANNLVSIWGYSTRTF